MNGHRDTETSRPSPAARERLERERAALVGQRRELAGGLGEDEVGDSGDSANALLQADELHWVEERLRAVDDLLAHGDEPPEGLPPGTQITLRFPDGTVETLGVVALVEEMEERGDARTLTPDSPLGRALVGRQAGDDVTYLTPDGQAHAHVVALDLGGEQ